MSDNLIELDTVSKSFNNSVVLSRISLEVKRNKILTIIGPNGAGKTTLLRIILGIISPDFGEIRKNEVKIGYMPQKLQVNPWMPLTVLRFLKLTGCTIKEIEQTCEHFNVVKLFDKFLIDLSGGELQKVLLARAMLKKPDLLVLDEPAQGVDVLGQVELYKLLSSVKISHGCGIVIVSHDLHLVMSETDYVVCLNKHVCCSGTPEVVKQDSEYLSMFGKDITVYTHKHDHRHD